MRLAYKLLHPLVHTYAHSVYNQTRTILDRLTMY